MNNKIILIKTTSAIFLAIVLVTGTIAISFSSSSSFMTADAQTQPSYYNGFDNNNYKSKYSSSYLKDSYKKDSINKNKIKCINDNININGENAGNVSIGNKKGQGYFGADSYGEYDGGYDGYSKKNDKGFDCIINNNNNNTNIAISEGNQTVPEPEPEPTIPATLTVKKQVFGCDNIIGSEPFQTMDCSDLQNNSSEWLDCNNNINPDFSHFCQSLPESIFDIEVLDDQNTLIQEFVGSEEGTTIQNLEPGTYTVNEIKHPTLDDQLGEDQTVEGFCINENGFPDGGILLNLTASIFYLDICFEYEDEQGNDCSTITLAAGEERTCTVKNYIRFAQDA